MKRNSSKASRPGHLLALPTELRIHIFGYVLQDMRCRRPLLIWDDIWAIHALTPTTSTAILSVCHTTCHDCIGLLYDTTPIEIILRKPELNAKFLRHHYILEAMEGSSLLHRLRHMELEVMYDVGDVEAARETTSRIYKFAHILRDIGKLKTLDLVFFAQRKSISASDHQPANQILEAVMFIQSQELLNVSRNLTASRNLREDLWQVLKSKTRTAKFDEESFGAINCEYWEPWFERE